MSWLPRNFTKLALLIWDCEYKNCNPKTYSQRQFGQNWVQKSWEEIDRVLHYAKLPYVPKSIWMELMGYYHDKLLARYFEMKKTRELVTQKYYYDTFQYDIKT